TACGRWRAPSGRPEKGDRCEVCRARVSFWPRPEWIAEKVFEHVVPHRFRLRKCESIGTLIVSPTTHRCRTCSICFEEPSGNIFRQRMRYHISLEEQRR